MKIPKIITDTLQDKGKWSIKRMAGFSAFYAGILYAFLPAFLPTFVPLEFIFWGIFGFAGTVIIGSTWEKMKGKILNENE